MKPMIAITMGDPAGIGPEIIVKAFSKPLVNRIERAGRFVVVGDRGVLEKTARRIKHAPGLRAVPDPEAVRAAQNVLSVIDLKNVDLRRLAVGRPGAAGGRAAVGAIRTAVELALARRVAAIVTAPISKEGLHAAGYPFPGHTELLAELTGSPAVGMLMAANLPKTIRPRLAPQLRILLATTHVAIRDLPERLTRECVETAIRLAHDAAVRYFGLRRPRLAVAGLNPHAGEAGLFGREEFETIGPAVEQARRDGLPVAGPFPADSLIRRAVEGKYDLVVAMYHDQALIPIKLLGFGRAVNVTVGLPFVRTSPDHGTAYDIAGKGVADPSSLIEAIRLAAALAKKRKIGRAPYPFA